MKLGKLVGYAILSLLDALLPPVFVVSIAFLVAPPGLWEVLVPYLVALAGLAFLAALLAGVFTVYDGGKPFPLTRGSVRVFRWLLTGG